MTATNLDAMLKAADLTDADDRRELADALLDAGRDAEAGFLQSDASPLFVVRGTVTSIPPVDGYQHSTDGGVPVGYVPGWFILWGTDSDGEIVWELEQDTEHVPDAVSLGTAHVAIQARHRDGSALHLETLYRHLGLEMPAEEEILWDW